MPDFCNIENIQPFNSASSLHTYSLLTLEEIDHKQ